MASRHAVVAGGGMGIGEAVVRRLVADDFAVTIFDRAIEPAQALAAQLRDAGKDVIAESADITDEKRMQELAARLRERAGPSGLTAAVSSVGVFDERRALLNVDLEAFRRVININVLGALVFAQATAPLLAAGGSLVYIGSVHGKQAGAGLGAYKVSKAALNMFVRCLALELARDTRTIRVNVVAPGWVDTPGERRALGDRAEILDDPHVGNKWMPLGRRQRVDEIAEMVAYLCSDKAAMITGQILYVDGGASVAGG